MLGLFKNIFTGIKAFVNKRHLGNKEQLFYSLTLDSHPQSLNLGTKYIVATPGMLCQLEVPPRPLPPLGLLYGLFSLQSFHFHLCSSSCDWKQSFWVCVEHRSWTSFCPCSWWSRGPSVSVRSEHFCSSLSATPTSAHSESTCLRGTSLLNGVFTPYRPASGLCCAQGETDGRTSSLLLSKQPCFITPLFQRCAAKEKILVCALWWKIMFEEVRRTHCYQLPQQLGVHKI